MHRVLRLREPGFLLAKADRWKASAYDCPIKVAGDSYEPRCAEHFVLPGSRTKRKSCSYEQNAPLRLQRYGNLARITTGGGNRNFAGRFLANALELLAPLHQHQRVWSE